MIEMNTKTTTRYSAAKTVAQSAILIALALALSYAERFVPIQMLIPLPGVKLGLANVVTLTALYLLGTKKTVPIVLARCLIGALFGNITGLFFSLTGGILSIIVMALCKKIPILSIYGVSILGAAAHNIGQILAATVIMGSIYVSLYLPYLLIIGIFTGIATGTACAGILRVFKSVRFF